MKLTTDFFKEFQQLNVAVVEKLNGLQYIPEYNELTIEDFEKGLYFIKEKVKSMENLLEKTVKL